MDTHQRFDQKKNVPEKKAAVLLLITAVIAATISLVWI